MYRTIVFIQCASIAILLAECWVVFKNWKSTLHSYLFLACVTTLLNSAGYLFELTAQTEDAYFTALRLSYFGRVWAPFALLLFCTELVHVHVPKIFKLILGLFSAVTYAVVLTTRYTGLYYRKETSFTKAGEFWVFQHENGVWYYAYMAVLALYALSTLFVLYRAMRKEKDPKTKEQQRMVLFAILVQGVFLFSQMLKVFPVCKAYDISMLSFPIAALLMFRAIFRYDLLDMAALARQYVVEQLSEAIIAVDADGEVKFSNPPAHKLFPELRRQPKEVVEQLRAAIEENEPLHIGERIYKPNVNELARDGRMSGTLYALVDETEHYRYIDELEEQKRLADAANRAKSTFLASMSHEIRTPINAILGMDEMILRESGEEQVVAYAGDIQNAGRTLLSIINDILDLSKIEEGKMEILPARYDLSSLVNDLVNMTRPRAEDKGLRFDAQVDAGIPHLLFGDEIRIRQCALNILTNAVKYTKKGSVTMRVGYEKLDEKRIALKLSVSDTGIGMKAEDMERLFAPFERIEEKRNRGIEGTGLGMSITKQLLALMGTSLDVQSVYGEGSTFAFAVEQPVVKWEPIGDFTGRCEQNAPRKEYRELFHAPDARILVVDDTPVNLAVIRGLLKKTRVQVVTAASGREALEKAARETYDAIFIDHMMPEMDGVETLQELKKLPGAENVPCVALTANAITGARELYLEAGFSDYLSKPVDGAKLERMLLEYLPPEKVRKPSETPAPASAPSAGTAAPEAAGPATVLIVDDDVQACRLAESILGKSYRVEACQIGGEAPEMAARLRPALILLDINLGDMTGFDVLRTLRKSPATDEIPVMFLTGASDEETEIEGFRNGAADFVRKPFVPEVLLRRTGRIIALDRLQRGLRREVRNQTLRAEHLTREMMLALSKAVDAKDHYTNGHSERVAAYSAEMARRLGKSQLEQEHIYEMGLLHDVGKIGVPEEIINKTSRLTDEEFEKIKRHTVIGSEILRLITEMPELADGARSHHERYDGTGYPDALRGTDIPEAARIICLADCYDAMTSTRTYSSPMAQDAVRAEIERCAGTQFDPAIAKVLLAMIDEDKDYVMTERTADIRVWKGSDRLWTLTEQALTETEPAAAEAEESAAEEAAVTLPDWLDRVDGLDTHAGLRHCGTEETYLETLTIFARNASSGADEIESFRRANDAANATVKVHALKSMARTIGAEALGTLAEKLELAGKAGDTDTLFGGLDELLESFRALGESLAPLCGTSGEEDASLPLISDEELREAYDSIRELAANLDTDNVRYVLDCLKGYRIPENERSRVGALRNAAETFDWDRINEVLS